MKLKPKKYILEKIIISTVYKVLGRGIKGVTHFDSIAHEYLNELPDGFTFRLGVLNTKLALVLKKDKNEFVVLKKKNYPDKYDLDIEFKNYSVMLPVVIGKEGVSQAYAQSRFVLYGEIAYSMIITNIINLTEAYLFPKFITKKFMDKIPKKKQSMLRAYTYVLFGIK